MFVSLCLKRLHYFSHQCLSRGKWCLTATTQKRTWECAASGLSLWKLIQREGKDAEFLSLQLAFVSESYFGKNETELFIRRILRSDKSVFQKLPGCTAEAERCRRVSLNVRTLCLINLTCTQRGGKHRFNAKQQKHTDTHTALCEAHNIFCPPGHWLCCNCPDDRRDAEHGL